VRESIYYQFYTGVLNSWKKENIMQK